MKVVSYENYVFDFNGKSWTVYNKEDAEYLDKQLKDAKRYQWIKRNGSDVFNAAFYNGHDIDSMIDEAIAKVAV